MKINQKGFSTIEVLMVVAIIGVLGLAGWYVWKMRTPEQPAATTSPTTAKPSTKSEAYKRTTTVPAGWKTFTDSKYPISFSYPSSWTLKADSKGNPDKCDYEIGAGASHQTYDVVFCINKDTLDAEAATLRKSYRTEGAGYSKLLSEKQFTIDGHKAIEFRSQQIGNAPGEVVGPVWKQYLVAAGENVYTLPAVSGGDRPGVMPAIESLTLFESIKIK